MTTQTQQPAVHLENINVTLEKREVLSVDSFTLQEGEICALMGPNGAGKTTFLRLLLGMILKKTQGQIELFGQRITPLNQKLLNRLRRKIGYIPQQSMVAGEFPLTVREAVASGRSAAIGLFKRLQPEDWQAVEYWLQELGISSLAERCLNEISGGEQRKVMIARAMAQNPRLLLLDEPTANLDMGWREQIIQTIQTLYQQAQMAFILVCHELETVPACCKRVVLINQGKVQADGSLEQVFTPERIHDLYGCRMSLLQRSGRYFAIPAPPSNDSP
ncbi:MAG: metal ABC transporter ATP-binding protein [Limisphaerales bacterium]|mgnify:CR=1 FL=1|nr:metal ABC transporter ATP-binding protein [Verrucomicrobiota bacterium]